MRDPIRVLICDDHPIIREAVRSRLETMPEAEVTGEAGDGETAIARVRELNPDLVLIDVEMPGLDGIDTARRIVELRPGCRVLMFSAHNDPSVAALAAESGASGYLLKSASVAETRHAILAVADGRTWFPDLPDPGTDDDDLTRLRSLTPREREILDLLAEGLRADGVARRIGISRATVYTHVRNAVGKLGVDTRTQAVAIATRYSFISPAG
ncbi:MAG: response regulator transcription factor [Solirubrobacterales bacterium]|nr:response regulator transcription factor [Solirubrobacterales bacterium]